MAVEETRQLGWWLPGGFVENGDDFESTAHKETLEEAGIEIELKGILRVESSVNKVSGRQRVIWFAYPKEVMDQGKTVADEESLSWSV